MLKSYLEAGNSRFPGSEADIVARSITEVQEEGDGRLKSGLSMKSGSGGLEVTNLSTGSRSGSRYRQDSIIGQNQSYDK